MDPILFILPAVMVGLILLQAFVARVERRMVWAYGTPQVSPPFGDPNGYGAATVTAATQAGFTFYGWAPDMKGEKYRVSYALLVSPGNDSFAVIGVGTIFGITIQGASINTPSVGDRSHYSTNQQSSVEIDVSRAWKSQLVPHADFNHLWQKHREWLASQRVIARGFQKGREFEDFHAVRLEHFRSLARGNYIAFTDGTEIYWRYTFYGAIKLATLNYSIGMLRTLTGGRIPRTA